MTAMIPHSRMVTLELSRVFVGNFTSNNYEIDVMLCYFVSEHISAQFLVMLPKILNMYYPLKIVIIIIIHMSE